VDLLQDWHVLQHLSVDATLAFSSAAGITSAASASAIAAICFTTSSVAVAATANAAFPPFWKLRVVVRLAHYAVGKQVRVGGLLWLRLVQPATTATKPRAGPTASLAIAAQHCRRAKQE